MRRSWLLRWGRSGRKRSKGVFDGENMRCFSSVIPKGSSLFSVDYVVRSLPDNRNRTESQEEKDKSGQGEKASLLLKEHMQQAHLEGLSTQLRFVNINQWSNFLQCSLKRILASSTRSYFTCQKMWFCSGVNTDSFRNTYQDQRFSVK